MNRYEQLVHMVAQRMCVPLREAANAILDLQEELEKKETREERTVRLKQELLEKLWFAGLA